MILIAVRQDQDYVVMAWEWLAPVSTGAVGVAGIIGTIWGSVISSRTQLSASRLQSAAETQRLLHADKRAIFAKMLYQLETLADTAYDAWGRNKDVAEFDSQMGDASEQRHEQELALVREQRDQLKRYVDLRIEANKLHAEVAVLAGPEIHDLVNATLAGCAKIREQGKRTSYTTALNKLAFAMHQDLMSPLL
ncbi:hypothetical protein [Micromonospora avicenniae]|uniref:hypothetical protein n=1 Tax=Micromonospora avicenniae TaxID=1198245 RepID=UPI00332DF9A1